VPLSTRWVMTGRRDRPWSRYRVGAGFLGVVLAGGLTAHAFWRPDPDAVYEQTLASLEAGRFEAAESGLARLRRLREPTVLDWGVRARVAIARGRTDDALAALGKIPEGHPLSGWAFLRAGQLDARRRSFRKAEAALRRALGREPGLVQARRELIYILGLQLRRGELDEQFARLAEQSTLTPHEVWVWCMSRDLVWWTPGEHAAILEAAVETDPDDRWSRLALVENHRRQGHLARAGAILAPMPPSDPDARAARAGLAIAGQDFETAAALVAGGPVEHLGLAGLRGRLALTRRDGPAAVGNLQRVAAAEPDRRSALADLGHAWLLAGDDKKGQPYLDAAARVDALNNLILGAEPRINSADPALWLRLGAACEAAGRPRQARCWYVLAVQHDPLDGGVQRALHRLDTGGERP